MWQECWCRIFRVLLCVSLIPCSGIQARENQSDQFEKLESQLFRAYRDRDYERALELAGQLHELDPEHVDTLYNLASLHRLLGRNQEALRWLTRAVEGGGLRSRRMEYIDNYIAQLERKDRANFQKPEQVMTALGFRPGERVADVGAGSGYFTIPIAQKVGPGGVVWAVDIEQAMLDYIEVRVKRSGLKNVRLWLVPPDDPRLPDSGVDTILLVDSYHFIENRADYAKKLRRALAPEGRVVVIDYVPRSWKTRPWGPLPHQQVSRETVDGEMEQAGLYPVRVHDFLPEQYFVEYRSR